MKILAALRLIIFASIMSTYILIVVVVSIFIKGDKSKASIYLRRPTIKSILFFLGVRIVQSGNIPKGTTLFIGNHISYLDPFVLVNYVLGRPVAKQEVASWPLIGYGCRVSGVLFVQRREVDSLRSTRNEISKALLHGDSVVVYPEGTTTDGRSILPFKRGVFDIASANNISITPVTVFYENAQASFVRKDKFLPHFFRLFSNWRIRARIHFGDSFIASDGMESAARAQDYVSSMLRTLIHQSKFA